MNKIMLSDSLVGYTVILQITLVVNLMKIFETKRFDENQIYR